MHGRVERLPLGLDRLAAVDHEELLELLPRHPEAGDEALDVGLLPGRIEGPLDVSESDQTVNVWGSDRFSAPPCFIFFVLALRAVNYEIFRRGFVDRVRWKPAFSAPELSVWLGFMASALPN